ncbi:hypothetical protein ACPYPE_23615 [Streptomyces griseus]|uniref:hypothetical protein n=1 Tax=Streptomyces griseus TaxID=1911 RepID=UPI003CEF4F37
MERLVGVAKETYTAPLGEGVVPRPLKVGRHALPGITELANIAAAAGSDEVVLAWETHDVATACQLPIFGPAPCLNAANSSWTSPLTRPLPPASRRPHDLNPHRRRLRR